MIGGLNCIHGVGQTDGKTLRKRDYQCGNFEIEILIGQKQTMNSVAMVSGRGVHTGQVKLVYKMSITSSSPCLVRSIKN
jgi:hypothetical protein